MTDHEQNRHYRVPKHRRPDRLLMFLVPAFIGKALLRAFWFSTDGFDLEGTGCFRKQP